MERLKSHYSDQKGHFERGKFAKIIDSILGKNSDLPISRAFINNAHLIKPSEELAHNNKRAMPRHPRTGKK